MRHVSGRGGVIGAAAARVGGGNGGARSGFRRKKTAGRLTGQARLSVRGRWRGRLGWKGGGREVGHAWAGREGRRPSEEERERAGGRSHRPGKKMKEAGPKLLLGLKSKEVKENQFLIDF
jgi:hypothetical protein